MPAQLNLDAWREVRSLIATVDDEQVDMRYLLAPYRGGRIQDYQCFEYPAGSRLRKRECTGCIGGYAILSATSVMPEDAWRFAAEQLGLNQADGWFVFRGHWLISKVLRDVTRQDVLGYLDNVIKSNSVGSDKIFGMRPRKPRSRLDPGHLRT